jgi:Ala-tRNA(Pro) deacylase
MEARTVARAFLDELDAAHVPYELIPHARTESALDEAETLGVEPWRVGKTIILTTPDGYVRAVLPASRRLDLHKIRELLDTDVRLATERALAEAYSGFELGAVPPIGGPSDRVLLDGRLCASDSVVVEAGTHDESVRMRSKDLVRITGALLGDLCHD